MKKYYTLIFILVLFFRAEGTVYTPITAPSTGVISIEPINATVYITTAKTKDIEKLLGRKLKLKEKIALKVFQWKYKKGLRVKNTEKSDKKGKAALILGIIGISALLIPYLAIIALPCAILAIIFGNQAKKQNPNNGQAKAGVILGWVTVGLFALALIVVLAILSSWNWL